MEDVRVLVVERDEALRDAAVSLFTREGAQIDAVECVGAALERLDASPVPLRFAYLTDDDDACDATAIRVAAEIRRHSPRCYVVLAPGSLAALDSTMLRALLVDALMRPGSDLSSVVRLVMAKLIEEGGLREGTRVVEVMFLALLGYARGEIQDILDIASSTLRDYLGDAKLAIELAGIHDVFCRALLVSGSDVEGLLREFIRDDPAAVQRALAKLQPPTRPCGRGRIERGTRRRGPTGRR